MDRIINYLLLTIIFVFDPLAIALVIAANFAFEQLKGKTKKNLYREIVPVKKEEEEEIKEEEIKDEEIIESDSSLPKGYALNELEMLERQLKGTSLANKRGPDGRINLKKKIDKLKNSGKGDDLVIKY